MLTTNTQCFRCGTPLYKAPHLIKEGRKFSCSKCFRIVASERVKNNPKIYEKIATHDYGNRFHKGDNQLKGEKSAAWKSGKPNCPICGSKMLRTSKKCKNCSYKQRGGKNHWHWKGGITTKNTSDRLFFAHTIGQDVLRRDNYTCQVCGQRGGKLQVDHIQPWAEYVELRFSMDNCRTVCRKCHYKITYKRELPLNNKWGIVQRKVCD